MRLRSHGAEEGAGVTAPAAIRPLVVGDQRTCELLDVVVVADLAEQVPARGTRLEGVENDIAAPAAVERAQEGAVRTGNDGTVAARECRAEQLADGGALAGAGSADQLEVLDLVLGCDREPRERQTTALAATRARDRVRDAGAAARGLHRPLHVDDERASLVGENRPGGPHHRSSGDVADRRAHASADRILQQALPGDTEPAQAQPEGGDPD